MTRVTPRYGRLLEDFEVGSTYPHPWEVTVDSGFLALFQGSFLDATPTYASSTFAQALGFRDRPVPPLVLMNLGLSFSVHDVSEQAIAHLAYLDVRFPYPAYAGDTLIASSEVLGKKTASSGDKGVVHVRTVVENQHGKPVCIFERKALVRCGGPLEQRPDCPFELVQNIAEAPQLPEQVSALSTRPERRVGFAGYFEDFTAGDTYCHYNGKTVSDSEHMQLTLLLRNSHPIHFDESYCKEGKSFAGTRVVYGGLVFGLVASLASRDVAGNAVWDLGFDRGAHPSGVVAGDTLYAATKVIETREVGPHLGDVTMRLVGLKNTRPDQVLDEGLDLFAEELKKEKTDKIKSKVFEVTRTLRVLRR
ncbi:MAG: MaoC family dehydratase [Myxococcota bacterium]